MFIQGTVKLTQHLLIGGRVTVSRDYNSDILGHGCANHDRLLRENASSPPFTAVT